MVPAKTQTQFMNDSFKERYSLCIYLWTSFRSSPIDVVLG